MFAFDGVGGLFSLKAVITHLTDLSFVDGYIPGDKYSITLALGGGSATYATQFLGPGDFDPINHLNAGPFGTTFGPDWLNTAYGHTQIQLTPGTYFITVKDVCAHVCSTALLPAGWGIRLNSGRAGSLDLGSDVAGCRWHGRRAALASQGSHRLRHLA